MSDMQDIYGYLDKCGIFYPATVDGDKPECRSVSFRMILIGSGQVTSSLAICQLSIHRIIFFPYIFCGIRIGDGMDIEIASVWKPVAASLHASGCMDSTINQYRKYFKYLEKASPGGILAEDSLRK